MVEKVCPRCKMENLEDARFCDNCGETLNELAENTQNNEKNGTNSSSTSSGLWWRLFNSWWILLTFILGFLSWAAFLYIGFTAKQRKWILWGLIYAIPLILALVANSSIVVPGLVFIWVPLFIIAWIASIIHAFIVREEYLTRLDIRKDLKREIKAKKEENMRKKTKEEYKRVM